MANIPTRRLNPTEFPTGQRHDAIVELPIPGLLPFRMERLYRTGENFFGPLGADQLCPTDLTIRGDIDGGYVFTDMSGIPVVFEAPDAKPGAQSVNPGRKDLILEPLSRSGFRVRHRNLSHDFELTPGRIWRLTATTDHLDRQITYLRDNNGLLEELRLPSGLWLDFENDPTTGLRTGYDLIGQNGSRLSVMRYRYDSLGRLTHADNQMGPSQF